VWVVNDAMRPFSLFLSPGISLSLDTKQNKNKNKKETSE
jgi:hypothetical protein